MLEEHSALGAVRALIACAEYEEAASALGPLIARSPEDAELRELRATALVGHGRMDDALRDYQVLESLRPLSVESQILMAECYWQTGDLTLSRGVYAFLAEFPAVPPELLSDVAKGLGRAGDAHRALAVCRRAVEATPESAEAWYGVAYYMARTRAPDESLASVLERCVRLKPSCHFYRVSLMSILLRLGRGDAAYDAVRDIPREALRDWNCGDCLARLAELYDGYGDHDRANDCRLRSKEP